MDTTHTPRLSSQLSQRLIKSYNAIEAGESMLGRMTDLLATSTSYMVALNMSKEINHKQGKLRFEATPEQLDLMKAAQDDSVAIINSKLTDTFVQMINLFLDFHFIHENMGRNTYTRIVDMHKILYIMLISNEQLDILSLLHTPDYILPYVEKVIDLVTRTSTKVYNSWISYLKENEAPEIVSKAELSGEEIFAGTKAIDSFNKCFRNISEYFKDYETTYDKFLEFRQEVANSNRSIKLESLYEIFDISKSVYDKKRIQYLIPEFQRMFTEKPEYEDSLKRLVFGK